MEKLLFSKKEGAAQLGISLRTLETLLARKELKYRRIGRRVLIPAKELESFALGKSHSRNCGGEP